MKLESAAIILLGICIFLSFYFAILTLQTTDEAIKKQLVFVAASSVIAGVILATCIIVYAAIKKAFSRMDNQYKGHRQPPQRAN